MAAPAKPFAFVPLVFVTGERHPEFRRVADIRGRVGVLVASPMEERLRREFPALSVVPYDDVRTGVEALAAGELDAYLGPLAAVGYLLSEARLTSGLRPVGERVGVEPLGFWSNRNQPMVGAVLDAAVAGLSRSEATVLFTKWTGFDLGPEEQGPAVPGWLGWGLAAASGLAVIAGVATLVPRSQVRRRTAELRRLNAELETRVEERTADLTVVNARFAAAIALLGDANRELGEANTDLETFVRSAGHDLRAPVRHSRFFAGLLLEDAPDLDDTARGHIDQIQMSAERMDRLLDSLLALARTTRVPPEPERVDVTAEVEGFAASLTAASDRRVNWSIQPGMAVWADPDSWRSSSRTWSATPGSSPPARNRRRSQSRPWATPTETCRSPCRTTARASIRPRRSVSGSRWAAPQRARRRRVGARAGHRPADRRPPRWLRGRRHRPRRDRLHHGVAGGGVAAGRWFHSSSGLPPSGRRLAGPRPAGRGDRRRGVESADPRRRRLGREPAGGVLPARRPGRPARCRRQRA